MNPTQGTIFDIKEMAVFDGPGIRTTVFLKGCPLRCQWCHNPEGLSPRPELMASPNGCSGCGACQKVCPSPQHCTACGACTTVCPLGLRRLCGQQVEAEELARRLLKDAAFLAKNGGGYTLSGGEPCFQPEFTQALLEALKGNHRALETSGYCPADAFQKILSKLELVLMDVKLVDPALHKQYTGVDNALILRNLATLQASGLPYILRIPLIPGVNDSRENLQATASLLRGPGNLQQVELMPYHTTAGAKYAMVGRAYAPSFDGKQHVNLLPEIFTQAGIPCHVL